MAKTKKKTLPKEFEQFLESGDQQALMRVFETCDINARGGYTKQTALAYAQCPDGITRWLVQNGADINAKDSYGETPLHARARHWRGGVEILIELGADLHAGENDRGTPLHLAAGAYHPENVRLLLWHGARTSALNKAKKTPLAHALERCQNINIAYMAQIAEMLIEADDKQAKSKGFLASLFVSKKKTARHQTLELQGYVTRIGTDFEFHRLRFNPEYLPETEAGLQKLYALFDVTPVAPRVMHDGVSTISTKTGDWQQKFEKLWEMLVPSGGAAATVQGELIRIASKITHELDGNGGINWDADFRKMADAYLTMISTGKTLLDEELAEVRALVSAAKKKQGESARLAELAVKWVELNPKPVMLPKPKYER